MRNLLIATLLASSSSAFAIPVTYNFSGQVTIIDLYSSDTGDALGATPNTPLVVNGVELFNGSSHVTGSFTYDSDVTEVFYDCSYLPLSYNLQTEGITFSKQNAVSCMDEFHAQPDKIYWHVEGPSLTQTGGPSTSIQDFSFNFSGGSFLNGTFTLGYMFGMGVYGQGITGLIDSITPVAVTEPTIPGMILLGSLGLFLTRREEQPTPRAKI